MVTVKTVAGVDRYTLESVPKRRGVPPHLFTVSVMKDGCLWIQGSFDTTEVERKEFSEEQRNTEQWVGSREDSPPIYATRDIAVINPRHWLSYSVDLSPVREDGP